MTDEINYKAIAEKLLDLEAASRSEGWPDPEAIHMVKQLNHDHGPFDLEAHHGQTRSDWELDQ